jgi:hypothetical protein
MPCRIAGERSISTGVDEGAMATDLYVQGEYLENNPTWHVQDSPWKAKHILKMIERNQLRPRSICEVGCGVGEILNQLQQRLSDEVLFDGYEIAPQAFELAKRRENEKLQFHLQDLLATEVSFDILLAIDVIEHVEDVFGFLRKLRSKATYKIFHIPLDLSAQTVLRGSPILRQRERVGHLHYFTKGTALAVLADTGYEVLDSFYTPSGCDSTLISLRQVPASWARRVMALLSPDMAAQALGGYSLMVLAK